MSIFDFECHEYGGFDISIKVNKLKIKFSADLNNVTLKEIQSFKRKFRKNKKHCTLYFIDTKKNSAGIEYEPTTNTLKFYTFNDGYTFCDTEANTNSVDIELILDKEDHDNVCKIIDELDYIKLEEGDYSSYEETFVEV